MADEDEIFFVQHSPLQLDNHKSPNPGIDLFLSIYPFHTSFNSAMAAYSGKNAVIVGGTHGIGLATAKALLLQGARVVITGRRLEGVESAKAGLNNKDALVVQSDITSLAAHQDLQTQAQRHFGVQGQEGEAAAVVDLVFINAGYAALGPFAAETEENFDHSFNVNTRGPFFIAQRLVPLVRPGGAIIFTTSVSIGQGIPSMAVYSASKAAIHSFAQTMAAELVHGRDGKPGIRVNTISPGFVETSTMGIAGSTPDQLKEFVAVGERATPMGRCAKPEEVAKAVLFLAFDATFTTGIEFLMDGGMRYLGHAME
jgi:NAD(P)-dependent dehydrogenase (short-subunit alcohol dehydrogenase family)